MQTRPTARVKYYSDHGDDELDEIPTTIEDVSETETETQYNGEADESETTVEDVETTFPTTQVEDVISSSTEWSSSFTTKATRSQSTSTIPPMTTTSFTRNTTYGTKSRSRRWFEFTEQEEQILRICLIIFQILVVIMLVVLIVCLYRRRSAKRPPIRALIANKLKATPTTTSKQISSITISESK